MSWSQNERRHENSYDTEEVTLINSVTEERKYTVLSRIIGTIHENEQKLIYKKNDVQYFELKHTDI